MRWTLRKWQAIFRIYFQEGIAYRASGVIWVMTDVVAAVTLPVVMARASEHNAIAGFHPGDFVKYYLCLFVVQSFVTSHIMWDLAFEIREGIFTTYLLRPISFWQYTYLRNLTWRLIRPLLFLPFLLILLFLYRGYLHGTHVYLGWEVLVALALGHLVSFSFVMAMSMLALFTQEAVAVFELYYLPMLFLSGSVFPIGLLPPWAQDLGRFFPFYYTVGAPTELAIGKIPPSGIGSIVLAQLVWIGVSLVAFKLLWRGGVKSYAAVGM